MQNVRWSQETNKITKEKKGKVKVKFTLEQTIKAQTGNRGVVLLFLQPLH